MQSRLVVVVLSAAELPRCDWPRDGLRVRRTYGGWRERWALYDSEAELFPSQPAVVATAAAQQGVWLSAAIHAPKPT